MVSLGLKERKIMSGFLMEVVWKRLQSFQYSMSGIIPSVDCIVEAAMLPVEK